jgi:hypothetical protein
MFTHSFMWVQCDIWNDIYVQILQQLSSPVTFFQKIYIVAYLRNIVSLKQNCGRFEVFTALLLYI